MILCLPSRVALMTEGSRGGPVRRFGFILTFIPQQSGFFAYGCQAASRFDGTAPAAEIGAEGVSENESTDNVERGVSCQSGSGFH